MSSVRPHLLERRRPPFSLAIAVASGAVAATADAHPVGSPAVDVVLVFTAATLVTWLAAGAPWWSVAAACGVAAGFAEAWPWSVAAGIGATLAAAIGIRRVDIPWAGSIAAGLALQGFMRIGSVGFLGLSALIGCSIMTTVAIIAIRRLPRTVRHRVWVGISVAAGLIVLAGAGLGVAAATARSALESGANDAERGLDLLNAGDISGAAAAFANAAASFADGRDQLEAPWGQLGRLLPVAAQNREAASRLAEVGADAMGAAAIALAKIDPDTLRVVNGRVDLDAVRRLAEPFADIGAAVDDIADTLGTLDSVWLASPLAARLEAVSADVARNRPRIANAELAVQVAPDMLGGSGARRYFVAFTTPAEARGLGGFMGNWAELTFEDGKVELSGFGRHSDLNNASVRPGERTIDGLDDFIRRWGRFGFSDADDTTSVDPWSLITMPPDFPTVAQVIAQLYPQSGGRKLDGALVMDPTALAALVSITGPIRVEGVDEVLDAGNLVSFILRDQYTIAANDQRIELLDEIAHTTMERILTSALPAPAALGKQFGPLTQTGHLSAWSAHPNEQALFEQLHMDGALPGLNGRDGIAVTIDNFAPNKIDAYLDVDIDYTATTKEDGGVAATLTVTMTNNAPRTGLADYVIGNEKLDLPRGSNLMYFSVYSALPVFAATWDGVDVPLQTGEFHGWTTSSTFLTIAAGESKTFEVSLAGQLPMKPYALVTRVQPTANVTTLTVSGP